MRNSTLQNEHRLHMYQNNADDMILSLDEVNRKETRMNKRKTSE